MKTADLLGALPRHTLRGKAPETLSGLQYDSRQVSPGDLFVCLEGLAADGHRFAAQAAEKGAVLIVVRKEPEPPASAPLVFVDDTREALARLAAVFYGHPSRELRLAGITGTNGKTTTTHFLTAIAAARGEVTGRIGTVGYDYAGLHIDAPHTTPEAPVLNRLLRDMVEKKVAFAAMEVSSHALEQRRAFGLDFAGVLFTNLTQDHLDYHPDLEAYYRAKRRLFLAAERGASGIDPVAVVNVDDQAGRRLSEEADGRVVTFGLEPGADYRASIETMDRQGTAITLHTPHGRMKARLRMVGPFNVLNATGAAALMREIGYPDDAIHKGLESLAGVPGRMESVDKGQPFLVLVDYAHTPDALERILLAARAATKNRLVAVFGCGGDRDRTKRPIMGRLATQLSDLAYLTSDNPRSEEPAAIVAEIEAGARQGGGRYEVLVDRRSAIEKAIRGAEPGDTVVLAGKGHEPYQILKDRTIHFDDREEAARILAEMGYGDRHGR